MCADVAFIPVDRPGHEGSGSVRTSSLLIEHLSKFHDLSVYVFSTSEVDYSKFPATERVDYKIECGIPKYPEPKSTVIQAIRSEIPNLEEHDLVHSYGTNGVVGLSELSTPSIVTLNAYGPVCPKNDLMWHGKKKCAGSSTVKCTECALTSTVSERGFSMRLLKDTYKRIYRINVVKRMKRNLDRINQYHALSPHIKTDFSTHGVDSEKITVIPHFYDERFATPLNNNELEKGIELLYVGSVKKQKGVQILVEAMSQIVNSIPNIRLRVVGNGPYLDTVQHRARELGVDQHIVWEGHIEHPNLPEVYENADIFVYPGLWDEPFGRVLLEALASKTPIVGSDVGSVDYIIGDAGITFEAGNPSSLATAIRDLVNSYDERASTIDEQLNNFERENVLDEFNTLYERILPE
ncbi:glycosyltransferase family 4 protein [Halostagnicola sp. A-GB9-2]|uniref:glycosyltransferase family 4 protein n=1 Tax=Halostagnicola sp. A-GB9-2 TaxID=3048066 RepID=UPI0024C018BE|nr:glycosyltransferase family 4 protein [Halostagnicola sp. A-GB9-2]MDJ1434191.1 glycosyltransferase family 4 protein [Halostagnicola sp. A-GB9-2]